MLAGWIASGMPAPRETDASLTAISVTPASETLAIGDTRQLRVEARYSDGTTEDVTRWARYGSADQSVAQVDDKGQLTMRSHGETAVSVGFLTGVSLARVRSPFPNDIPSSVFDEAEQNNTFDRLVLAKLRELRIRPSGLCTDAEFIRRVYLDAAGILPTADRGGAISRRQRSGEARTGRGRPAGAARVRGLLGLQMVRLAARLEPLAGAEQCQVVL